MSAELTAFLIEGLLATSAACALVLLLRRPWLRAFGPAQLRLLWVLVPAALLAVALPAPLEVADAASVASVQRVTAGDAAGASVEKQSSVGLREFALWVWLSGSALSLLHFGRLQRRFRRQVGRMLDRGDGVYVAERADIGPAVLGLLRPRIIVPADFERRFDDEQQMLILAHERSHLSGGDLLASAVATGLRALYWFNPLIHFAAARMRHDHELASDAQVLQRHPRARRRYADTLLNAQLAVPGLPVGCLWQSSHPLKERLIMLKQPSQPHIRLLAGLATGLALTLGVSALAWSMQPVRYSAADKPADAAAPAVTTGSKDSGPTYNALKPPRYPKEAFEASQSGRLVLEVGIDAQGKPVDVSVASSTNPGVFDAAAIEAVKGWKFNPAVKDGKPVASRVHVPVCFSLTDDSACPGPDAALDGIYIRPAKAAPTS